ncbi:GNAT family N-acetyltransferase [Catellatospora bangladeshensis]|nr:GNAT family N-acetyltransferase [Catellatospora bangladeshensis]
MARPEASRIGDTGEWPLGATVVVRRADGPVLLMHRTRYEPDDAGPWAWTAPAGGREPGEALLATAVRELREETGLTGLVPVPVDLSGSWALFAAEAGADAEVVLNGEHDRFVWARPERVAELVQPRHVAGRYRRALGMDLSPLTFRPLARADLPDLVRWLQAEHVSRWWAQVPADVAAAEGKYGPRIDGVSPTAVDVVLLDGRPVGFIQSTPLAAQDDYLETARWVTRDGADCVSIDYAVGEPSLAGRGFGTRLIWEYVRDVVPVRFPGNRFVVADPATANTASVRACEKAGFRRAFDFDPGEGVHRHALCVFERARALGG